jgi:hypothetical protein
MWFSVVIDAVIDVVVTWWFWVRDPLTKRRRGQVVREVSRHAPVGARQGQTGDPAERARDHLDAFAALDAMSARAARTDAPSDALELVVADGSLQCTVTQGRELQRPVNRGRFAGGASPSSLRSPAPARFQLPSSLQGVFYSSCCLASRPSLEG